MTKGVLADGMFGPAVEGPAEEMIIEAWEAKTPAQTRKKARKALELDPDCIDAHVLLAHYAETDAEAAALLRAAVDAGDRVWKDLLKDKEMEWWGFIGTRPYMRAMHELGMVLERLQRKDEATVLYKKLLRLNKNDNQGIRCLLIGIYMADNNQSECEKIVKKYKDDYQLESQMAVLWLQLLKGESPDKQIEQVEEHNQHVLPLLKTGLMTGKWPNPPAADWIAMGSEEEASSYLAHFSDAWNINAAAAQAFVKAYD